jgi:membrane protease YdiL (CAAX protease family)
MLDNTENILTGGGGLPAEGLQPSPSAHPLAPREIWKPRDLLLFAAFIPFALLAANLALLIGYTMLRPFTGWHAKVDLAQSNTIFLLLKQCVFYVLILAFFFLLARLQHQQPLWKSLGWKKPSAREVLGYLAGGCGLALVASFGLWLLPDTQAFPLEKLFSSRTASIAVGAFAVLVAPVVEELVLRGLLFAILERAVGLRIVVVTTAVLFAGLHVPEYWHAWNHLLMILLVGMVFSLARGMSGSLTPSIVLHIGYNSLIMIGVFFSTQHFHNFSGFLVR